MRRAAAVLLVVALIVAVVAPPAQACLECVALGLASFAVFTQLVSAVAGPRVVYAPPASYPWYGYPAAYSTPYPAYYACWIPTTAADTTPRPVSPPPRCSAP